MRVNFTKMLLFIALLFITANSFSQNPTLTKGETISYINKILKEAVGKTFLWNGETYTYTRISLSSEDENTLILIIEMNDDIIPARKYSFTPKEITLKEGSKASDTVGQFTLSAKNSIYYYKDSKGSVSSWGVSSFEVPYSRDNAENFNRIEKAFKYLGTISKEVNDPFGK